MKNIEKIDMTESPQNRLHLTKTKSLQKHTTEREKKKTERKRPETKVRQRMGKDVLKVNT